MAHGRTDLQERVLQRGFLIRRFERGGKKEVLVLIAKGIFEHS